MKKPNMLGNSLPFLQKDYFCLCANYKSKSKLNLFCQKNTDRNTSKFLSKNYENTFVLTENADIASDLLIRVHCTRIE